MRRLIRQGEGPAGLLRLEREERERQAKLDKICDAPLTSGVTAGGDWARLRGLPVLTHGVGGAQLGSRPEREVLRLDREDDRTSG